MPYALAVLAFIIIGVGYTLFQKDNTSLEITALQPLISQVATNTVEATTDSQSLIKETQELEAENQSDTPLPTPPKNTPVTPSNPTPTPEPANPAPTPIIDNNTYTNGTYRTQSTYRTPDGTYTMDVTLTIANDSVSAANLSFDSNGARDGYSKRFSSSYQSQVVGKNLSNLNLSRTGGASLTTKAFNSALNTIRSQAS